jgi:hypothetical protein
MSELKSEFLFEVEATLDDPQMVGTTPQGARMIYPVLSGTFSGPKFKGEVLPFGADWMLMDAGGVGEIDVRITLKTDEGEFLYVYYRGVLNISPDVMIKIQAGEAVDPSEYYFRTTPVFETGSEKLGWLNHIVCVGVGQIFPNRVKYHIYQIL